MKKDRSTVGAITQKLAQDSTHYNALELGHALCDDVLDQVWQCIDNNKDSINENEFCVVMLIGDDNLIRGVMRRKFYAWPFLPSPRPRQSVFLYRKNSMDIQFLWSMPDAKSMAILSMMITVSPEWRRMKGWVDAFYAGKFWEHIRHDCGIDLESEHEYLKLNRDKLIQAGCKQIDGFVPDSFDFSKITNAEIIDPRKTVVE